MKSLLNLRKSKEHFITILIFSALNLNVFAQYNSDSLQALLPTANDSTKLDALLKLTMANFDSDPDQALEFGYKAINQAKKMDTDVGLFKAFNLTGIVYDIKSMNDSAMAYYDRAYSKATKINNKKLPGGILNNIDLVDSATPNYGNVNEAYHNFNQERLITDSLSQIETEQKITQLNNQFKLERYQAQLKYTTLLHSSQERIRRLLLLGFMGLLIGALAFVIVIYSRYKVKKKAELDKAYSDLDKVRFRSVIETQEKERKRIAQELHDGIGQLLSSAKLNMASLENHIPQDEPKEFLLFKTSIKLIDNACKEVRNVSHNMMPIALAQKGLNSALKDLILQINASNTLSISLDIHNLDNHLNEALEISLYRIVQESISNIIKHASATKAIIKIDQIGQSIHLLIKDNGKGFDTSIINKAEGIGWNNIYSRVSLMNGKIDVHSTKEKGTELSIKIAA